MLQLHDITAEEYKNNQIMKSFVTPAHVHSSGMSVCTLCTGSHYVQGHTMYRVTHYVQGHTLCTGSHTISRVTHRVSIPLFTFLQMCYLKGRITGKHTHTHSVMELKSYNSSQKGWHKLFSSSSKGGQDCTIMAEPQEPFLHTPKFSFATVR